MDSFDLVMLHTAAELMSYRNVLAWNTTGLLLALMSWVSGKV